MLFLKEKIVRYIYNISSLISNFSCSKHHTNCGQLLFNIWEPISNVNCLKRFFYCYEPIWFIHSFFLISLILFSNLIIILFSSSLFESLIYLSIFWFFITSIIFIKKLINNWINYVLLLNSINNHIWNLYFRTLSPC